MMLRGVVFLRSDGGRNIYFIWPGNPRTDSQLRHSMPLADALPSMVHFSKSRRRARIHLFPSSFIFFPPIPGPTDRARRFCIRPSEALLGEGERETNERLPLRNSRWMDGSASLAACFVIANPFLRFPSLDRRERERMEWTMEWRINEVRNPFPGCKLRALFLSALPASENHGRGRSGE